MALIHWTGLMYLRNGFTMLEMAYEFDKRFKYVGNDVYIWKMAQVFEKRLNYLGRLRSVGNLLNMCSNDLIL